MSEVLIRSFIQLNYQKSPSVDIAFRNVSYRTEGNQKLILNDLSGIFHAGQLSAIMGPSGSGKTSLLNTLAGRIRSQYLSGTFTANGLFYSSENFGDFANYVMQNDVLIQTLTVRETLKFAADLKLKTTEEEKNTKILFLAKKLKLEKCLDVLVGGQLLKGISGGERKRTSIAFELISNPSVLILDEPTSGLDSLTSYIIVEYLRQIANSEGKTVILTIHQPNAEIFAMFDKLMLMAEGQIVYQGPNSQTLKYFYQNFRFQCPQFYNPADFLMDRLHFNYRNPEQNHSFNNIYKNKQKALIDKQIQNQPKSEIPERQLAISQWSTFKTLLYRDYLNMTRNPLLTKMRFVAIIFGALVSGITFIRLTGDYELKSNWIATLGFLFISPIGVFMTSFTPVALSFPLERAVFLKEENAKLYSTFSYFMSRNILDLPYTIISPVIVTLIVYWMVGLSCTPTQFFIYLLVMIITAFTGASLGLLIGSIVTDPKSVSIATPLIFQPCMLFAGFFKNLVNLPSWIGWIQYLSPIKYGFAAMVQNEVQFANAPYLPLQNFNNGLWLSIGLSFVLGIGLRIASLFFLWRLRKKVQ